MAAEQHSPRRRSRRRWLLAVGAIAAVVAVGVPVAWASHQFTDVTDANPFHTEIGAIAGAGITAGKTCVPPGTPPTFCPDEPVVRQAMAAFMARGFGRAGVGDSNEVGVGDGDTDIGSLQISVGGVPGSTQFVKIDAAVTTYISSTTGCPCETQYFISRDGVGRVSLFHYLTNDSVSPGGGFGDDSGAATAVVAVPTGTTQTFRVLANRTEDPAPGAVTGYGLLSAVTTPFGSTGGSTLGGELGGGPRSNGK